MALLLVALTVLLGMALRASLLERRLRVRPAFWRTFEVTPPALAEAGGLADLNAALAARRVAGGEPLARNSMSGPAIDVGIVAELGGAITNALDARRREIDRASDERRAEVPVDRWYHRMLALSVGDQMRDWIEDRRVADQGRAVASIQQLRSIFGNLQEPLDAIAAMLALHVEATPAVVEVLHRVREALHESHGKIRPTFDAAEDRKLVAG